MAGLCIHVRRGLACWLGTVLVDSLAVVVLTLILSASDWSEQPFLNFPLYLPEFYLSACSVLIDAAAFG